MSFYKKQKKSTNEKLFEELIYQEKHKLYRIAYLYVKNENDALEIIQETIYKAFISFQDIKNKEFFSTWIVRVLINTALDYVKKRKKIVLLDQIEEGISGHKTEEKIDVINAVKRLEEPYRTTIILRYYKDLKVKDIAEILDCPEGTVKTYLHRATLKLKLDLREGYGNE
ncbi:sigma-70 family RNA polymerase sigma factor [Priestia megaterium]|uniref:sigma-70 family RNA polymerase sigma factor n=1 Tax=Priestia megaterium TaxID=1404 RepID=UPI00203F2D5C|nr:sigma-70 family RNA polymerase sigma factor [Priestia megaterium]MCM3185998.1 sigma-70 family RNA polymerase sigma factor [Priestia megaterium]